MKTKQRCVLAIKTYIVADRSENAEMKLKAIAEVEDINKNLLHRLRLVAETAKLSVQLKQKSEEEIDAICAQWEKEIEERKDSKC